jgi:hypothetical protein
MEGLKGHFVSGYLQIPLIAALKAFYKNKRKSHFLEKHLSVLSF